MTPGTVVTTPTGHTGHIIRTENNPYGRICVIRLDDGRTVHLSAARLEVAT
ncbi:hypothetical protein [Pseudactinotalea sp. Z1748]|uniref:hypothetical protein n=1 Tax=Pseudactinotalea sp. Z1748 TaxID=3413027 RepID=UPI003C7E0145